MGHRNHGALAADMAHMGPRQEASNADQSDRAGHHRKADLWLTPLQITPDIEDRTAFMEAFNDVLADHPRYPLEISFYEDPNWEDLQTVHKVYLKNE